MSYAFGSGNLNSTLTLLLNLTIAPAIRLITTPLKIIISLVGCERSRIGYSVEAGRENGIGIGMGSSSSV